MAEGTPIKIGSEDEAWAVLARFLENDLPKDAQPVFDFEGWPSIEVYLPRTPIDGSISPTMMQAFLEVQDTIYRAHTFVESDKGDLRSLSKTERDDLEIRVQVKPGSSSYSIDLQAIVERIAVEAVGKMEPTHVVLTAVGIAVILAGSSVWKTWLNNRAEVRKKELDNEDRKAFITERQALAEEDTERFKLLLQAQQRIPILDEIDASADKARLQMVKAVSEEQGGSLLGFEIDPDFGQEIVANKRQTSEQVRITGSFTVAKVDTTVADGFRVTLTPVNGGPEITASMQEAIMSAEHKETIQKAEWEKKAVFVEMTARKLRTRIVDAVVVGASELPPA